ncbi:MAG: LysM peptidoglycan-binding domain-containing protein [Pseudomonadota bacterium]
MSASTLRARLVAAVCAALLLFSACQSSHTPQSPEIINASVLDALDSPGFHSPYLDGSEIAPGVELPDPDLWADIRGGFQLHRYTDEARVQQELRWLKRHPQYLNRMRGRLGRHLAYIHQAVEARGLPSELALLPIVESALDPYAFSHGGAAGLWQFIPATAKRFGLERNWWYDGRRDPVAATDAALDYLEYLHRRFDDWYLALAGYNAGEGNVNRARRRAPEGANFFQLKLPRETSAYVPRLLALAELVDNPEALGVTLPPLSPEVPFTVVDTGGQLDLSVASAVTEVDLDTLYLWNPALNQWSTPPSGPHHLILPKSAPRGAEAAIAAVPAAERVQWLRVKVEQGDTLSGLAQRHRTDVKSLKQANGLRNTRITVGDSLLIPKSPKALSNSIASRNQGDTYVVQSGDSLWTISRAHNVPVTKLMKANHVGPKDYLRVGQKLTLPAGATTPVAMATGREATIRKVRYGVRRGDSLDRIARKFNVRVTDIVSWNRLDVSDYLQPGQSLLLYVNVSAGGD